MPSVPLTVGFLLFFCTQILAYFDDDEWMTSPPEVMPCTVKKKGLTKKQIKEILERHNKLRQKVAQGYEKKFKAASDMRQLLWDDDLAALAQAWANSCNKTKQPNELRKIEKFGGVVGQNLYEEKCLPFCKGPPNFKEMINDWYNQARKPEATQDIISNFKFKSPICQFIQLIWSRTMFVGCGYALTASTRQDSVLQSNMFFCNYAPTGNVVGPMEVVYREGPTCTECRVCSTMYPGLCDSTVIPRNFTNIYYGLYTNNKSSGISLE